jgi:hypothetical protein
VLVATRLGTVEHILGYCEKPEVRDIRIYRDQQILEVFKKIQEKKKIKIINFAYNPIENTIKYMNLLKITYNNTTVNIIT